MAVRPRQDERRSTSMEEEEEMKRTKKRQRRKKRKSRTKRTGEGGVCVVFYPVPGWTGGVGSTMTITGGWAESLLCGRSRQAHTG